jgi:hypothetical protein
MTRISILFAALVTFSLVFANPIVEVRDNLITVPLVARINATGVKNFVDSQRARASHLIAAGRERAANRHAHARGENPKRGIVSSFPVTNAVVSLYLFPFFIN